MGGSQWCLRGHFVLAGAEGIKGRKEKEVTSLRATYAIFKTSTSLFREIKDY